MSRAIKSVHGPAARAGTAGVSGINKNHRQACASGLVRDKRPKLVERPAVQRGALAARNRKPRPNALQIFQSNRSLCVFRLRHKLLGDYVIHIPGKAFLLARDSFQSATRRLGALSLQSATQTAVTVSDAIDLTGRVYLTIRVNRDVPYAKIDSQSTLNRNRVSFLYFIGSIEEESTTKNDQVCFASARCQQHALLVGAHKWNVQAPLYGPDRDGRPGILPGEDVVIVGNAPSGLERPLAIPVESVGVGHLCDHAHGYLSGEPKLRPDIVIAQMMQVVLPEDPRLPSAITYKPARRVRLFHRAAQRVSLSGIGQKLDLCTQPHSSKYSTNGLRLQARNCALHRLGATNNTIRGGGCKSDAFYGAP